MAAGFIGPFVEEVFFRGGIFRGPAAHTHGAASPLLGISLLLRRCAPRSCATLCPIFLGGLAMGYVRILSGSIWPAILLHVAFNSTTVALVVRDGPDGPLSTLARTWHRDGRSPSRPCGHLSGPSRREASDAPRRARQDCGQQDYAYC